MYYLSKLTGTSDDTFNKLADDAQEQLEADIREDERKKIITELLKQETITTDAKNRYENLFSSLAMKWGN